MSIKTLTEPHPNKRVDEIDLVSITRILRVSRATAARLCRGRALTTARKKTFGRTSGWLASRAEVIQFKINTHAQPYI